MEARDGGLNRRDLLMHGVRGAALLAGGNLLAACGGAAKSTGAATGGAPAISAGPPMEGTPVRGGTLRVALLSAGATESLSPPKGIVQPDYLRLFNLFDPLFFPVPGGVAPGLATSAEANADATVWTLKLRDGVSWHDGKPFTADDVVYTIRSWGAKESAYHGQATELIDLNNVRKLDAHTVRVPLRSPFAAFPAFTAWITALVIQDGTTNFDRPIGTGPFKYGSFTPGKSSTFPANRDYWRGAPHVDELVVNSSFTDDAARANALVAGQVDIVPGLPFPLAKTYAKSGRMVLANVPGPAFNAVVMRVNVPPFNDPRVVQAFKLAVDRDAVVKNVYAGYATLGNDLVGHTWKDYASDIKPQHDPEKAKALLKAAGQEGLSLPLYTSPTLPGQNEVATVVSAQLKAIGVNAPLKVLPVDTYYTTAKPGYMTDQRKLSTTYWYNFSPSLGWFHHDALTVGAQFNETGWGHTPQQRALINEAIGEVNPAKATDKWHAVQEQQVKEGGYLIPAYFNWLDGYAPNVRGVQTNAAGANSNYDYHRAWLAR